MSDQVAIKEIHPCRRELAFQVPSELMEQALDVVYRRLGASRRLPGFRPGKVPRQVLERHFGKEARAEAMNSGMYRSYSQAVRERGLQVVGDPVFDEIKWEEKQALTFKAIVDVRPDVSVGAYRGIAVTRKKPAVTDEEIDRMIEGFRDRSALFEVVSGRSLQENDWALVDYRRLSDPAAPVTENILIEVKPSDPRGIPPQIVGMNPGERRRVKVFPAPAPGGPPGSTSPVEIEIALKEIKVKIIPDLSDELVRTWGDFSGMDEMKARVRESIQARKEGESRAAEEDQIVEHLLKGQQFPLPPGTLERTAGDYFREMGQYRDLLRGKDGGEVPEEKLKELAWQRAEKDLRLFFILEEIARREGIGVDAKALGEEVERQARQRKLSADALRRELEENGQISALESRFRRRAVMEFLLAQASIRETE